MSDFKFGLKQRFNIKYGIDLLVFIIILALFLTFASKHSINLYDTMTYLFVMLLIFFPVNFLTKQWVFSEMKRAIVMQSESLGEVISEIAATLSYQRKTLENLSSNTKNVSGLIEKLKLLSQEAGTTSKDTEKQVNQSITFSRKEHETIAANVEKVLVLRQKIQMIAELILELSEHTQQIGNTISVVDDIAEQTNMLALNAAVEAARAGEHGKGFAVVAGEIRKLADESKQAITKITSLTSNIQYTTNSTVMATEEGSKEIENIVKDINQVSANSETLLNQIGSVSESLQNLNNNSVKQSDIIEKLNSIDEISRDMSAELAQIMNSNTEKLSRLTNLSNEIKNSAVEG